MAARKSSLITNLTQNAAFFKPEQKIKQKKEKETMKATQKVLNTYNFVFLSD